MRCRAAACFIGNPLVTSLKNQLVLALALVVLVVSHGSVSHAGIKLIGIVSVPGDSNDQSGLADTVGAGTPHNLFGAISGMEHLEGNRYLALADRGPLDGASQFQCRFHEIELSIDVSRNPSVTFRLLGTTMLTTKDGQPLVGALEAFDTSAPMQGRRLDPEGIRIRNRDSVFVSDEYGPFLVEFSPSGRTHRLFPAPDSMAVANLSVDPKEEDAKNKTGRAANSGWEGLAITPDGRKLIAATQKSLLQDRLEENGKKVPGVHTRLVEFDLSTTASTRQLVYTLDTEKNGVSELLAVGNSDFLILERDSEAGGSAVSKRIYHITTNHATDVSQKKSLAGNTLPDGVVPVTKSLFIDLLDPQWTISGPKSPEKWEGLAFGPSLPDGRRVLIVAVDNDYVPEEPTLFAVFAIDAADLPDYRWEN